MKSTLKEIFEKCVGWGYTGHQVVRLQKYLTDEGIIKSTKERTGSAFLFEFDSWESIQNWIEDNIPVEGWVPVVSCENYGVKYGTTRNRIRDLHIEVRKFGFADDRQNYIKETDFQHIVDSTKAVNVNVHREKTFLNHLTKAVICDIMQVN